MNQIRPERDSFPMIPKSGSNFAIILAWMLLSIDNGRCFSRTPANDQAFHYFSCFFGIDPRYGISSGAGVAGHADLAYV